MASNPTAASLGRLSTLHGVFYAAADDLITRQLIEFGAHTRNELAMVLDHVREGEIFVDVGAHIGTFAIPIARKLGPRGKLLAIEGSPDTHALLERNVGTNGLTPHIQTICAIAGQGLEQHLQRVEVGGNTGAGFFIPDAASACHAVDARWMICAHGFARLDFLKIDVEGMESLVLRSVAPLLEARRPKLYIEIAAEQLARFGATVAELDRFLRGFGYRFFRNTGERNSANDLYVKTELASLDKGGGFFDLLALPE
jgi:FkbM family methyltransferase